MTALMRSSVSMKNKKHDIWNLADIISLFFSLLFKSSLVNRRMFVVFFYLRNFVAWWRQFSAPRGILEPGWLFKITSIPFKAGGLKMFLRSNAKKEFQTFPLRQSWCLWTTTPFSALKCLQRTHFRVCPKWQRRLHRPRSVLFENILNKTRVIGIAGCVGRPSCEVSKNYCGKVYATDLSQGSLFMGMQSAACYI